MKQYLLSEQELTMPCGLAWDNPDGEAWASDIIRLYSNLRRRLWIAKLKGWDKQKPVFEDDKGSRIYAYGISLLRNAWYVKSAIHEVSWLYKSRIKSINLEILQKKRRMEELEKTIEKVKDSVKVEGCRLKIWLLRLEKAFLQECLDKNYIPTIFWGGKRSLRMLSRSWIKGETYRASRNKYIYSMGDMSHNGNRNIRIWIENGMVRIKVKYPHKGLVMGDPWIRGMLTVPEKYTPLLEEALKRRRPYTVRVKHIKGKWFADITIKLKKVLPVKGRGIVAPDYNSNGIAYSLVTWTNEIVDHGWLRDDRLVHARANKRGWIRGNMVKRTFERAEARGFHVAAREELKMRVRNKKGRKANRKAYGFPSKKWTALHDVKASKLNMPTVNINPAGTSQNVQDIAKKLGCNHHVASTVKIAGRGLRKIKGLKGTAWRKQYRKLRKDEERRRKLSLAGKRSSGKFKRVGDEDGAHRGAQPLKLGSRRRFLHPAWNSTSEKPMRHRVDEGFKPEGYTPNPSRGGDDGYNQTSTSEPDSPLHGIEMNMRGQESVGSGDQGGDDLLRCA